MTTRTPGRHVAGECGLPVFRRASGRVLPVDDADRVLLLHGFDPYDEPAGSWWFTVGGGIESGEDAGTCATRELAEETGIVVDGVGEPVLRIEHDFDFLGSHIVSDDTFFVVRVPSCEVRPRLLTEIEQRTLLGHRWWPVADLITSTETIHPVGLASAIHELVTGSAAAPWSAR